MSIANKNLERQRNPKIKPLGLGRIQVERWFKIKDRKLGRKSNVTEILFGGFGLLDGEVQDPELEHERYKDYNFEDCRLVDENTDEIFLQGGDTIHVLYQKYQTLTEEWELESSDQIRVASNGLRVMERVQVAKPGVPSPYDEDDVGNEPKEEVVVYDFVASGSGLDPNIDGLRFFDTGEVCNGKPIYKSEASALSASGNFYIWLRPSGYPSVPAFVITQHSLSTADGYWKGPNYDTNSPAVVYSPESGVTGTVTVAEDLGSNKVLRLSSLKDESNDRRGRIVTQWSEPGVLSIRPVRENGFNLAPSYYYTTVGLPASAIHAADGLTKPDGSTSLGTDVTFFEPEVQNVEGFPTYTQYVIAADLGEEDDVLIHERDEMVRITDPGVMSSDGFYSTGLQAGSCGRYPKAASQPRTYRKKAKLQVYLSTVGTISEAEVAYTEEGIDWCSMSFYNFYHSDTSEGASSSGSWRSFSGFLNLQTTYDQDGNVIVQGTDGTSDAGVVGVYSSFANSTGEGSTTYNTSGIYRVSLKDYMKGPDGAQQYYLRTIITFP